MENGIKIEGEYQNNLQFAADVFLISESLEEAPGKLKTLSEEGMKAGLIINLKNKNSHKNIPNSVIKIGKDEVKIVEDAIYSGQTISFENSIEKSAENSSH